MQLSNGNYILSKVSANENYSKDEKHEKLQIEGTIRNIDEWKLSRDHYKKQKISDSNRFNSYWTQINWGHRNNKWTHENQINWQKPNHFERLEAKESIIDRDENKAETSNSEIEMIDPSKVSSQLAHLKFMRMEEKEIADKEI